VLKKVNKIAGNARAAAPQRGAITGSGAAPQRANCRVCITLHCSPRELNSYKRGFPLDFYTPLLSNQPIFSGWIVKGYEILYRTTVFFREG